MQLNSLSLRLFALLLAWPAAAQDPELTPVKLAVEPGFTCSAILSGLRMLLPIKADQEASTLRTLRQLSAYQTYSLKKPTAGSGLSQYLIHSPLESLSESQRLRVASQIAGIVEDAAKGDHPDRLHRIGLTLTGLENAEKYFAELEGTANTYQEMIARDDLNPELGLKKGLTVFARIAGPAVAFIGWKIMLEEPSPLTAMLNFVAMWIAWDLLSGGSVPLGQKTEEFGKLLNEARNFLSQTSSEHRVLAFSHQYKILPETYQQAMEEGVMKTEALVKEWQSAHRRFIPEPPSIGRVLKGNFKIRKPEVSYVTFDLILESSGPNPEDIALHVYVRSTKAKPTPKKPNIPAPDRKGIWQTESGKLTPIPVYRE